MRSITSLGMPPSSAQQSSGPTWTDFDLPALAADVLFGALALGVCGWVIVGHVVPHLVG